MSLDQGRSSVSKRRGCVITSGSPYIRSLCLVPHTPPLQHKGTALEYHDKRLDLIKTVLEQQSRATDDWSLSTPSPTTMPADSPKQGLFSSLTLGRASRTPKPASETLTHPLLGASTSSLNLAADTGQNDGTTAGRNGAVDISSLPYKPRHKPGHAYSGSGSSLNATGSMSIPTGAASTSPVTAGISSSPVTPTSVSARATTSTFTSTTFALPSSATDLNDSQDLGASIGSSSTATSRLQLQSLKAAAQRIGLGNGSMGMTLIDAVFDKSLSGVGGKGKAVDNGEWSEPLKVLMSGEVSLRHLYRDPGTANFC